MKSRTTGSKLLALLVLAARLGTGNPQVVGTDSRISITLEYIYQLEVNATSDESSGNVGSVVQDIDASIVSSLQDSLPNGTTPDDSLRPDVKYNSIASEVTGTCFTESATCRWITSTLDLSYAEGKPEYTVEQVTINLVQDYLKAYSERNTLAATATYTYPMIVSGWGQFQILPVSSPIALKDIAVLEKSFLEVFGAIVIALDGDTVISQAHFYENFPKGVSNQTARDDEKTRIINSTLWTDVQFYGKCRNCSDDAFAALVNNIIGSALEPFQYKLTEIGRAANSSYFESINSVSYSEREMPDSLPPMDDFSIFDSQPPESSPSVPWYLYFAASMAMVVICVGVFLIRRDRRSLEKEDVSTGESESDYGDEGRDVDVDAESGDIDTGESRKGADDYSKMNDTTISSRVQSSKKKTHRKEFEVYVY